MLCIFTSATPVTVPGTKQVLNKGLLNEHMNEWMKC